MASTENIGYFGQAGAQFRDDLFGPLQRGRYGAFNDFLVDTQCLLLGALEAGSVAAGQFPLANGWAFSRGFNGCYSGTPPVYQKELPENGYFGGQCATTYDGNFSIEKGNGVVDDIDTAGMLGPIVGFRANPVGFSGGASFLVEYTRDGVNWLSAGGGTVSPLNLTVSEPFNVVITRRDGQPDDCGNGPQGETFYPDPVEPSPTPSDGDVIAPGRDIVVPVDVDGTPVDLGVNIGDATFCFGGSICISVDGIPHRINPDGGIDVFPDSPGGGADTATDSELLDDIAEELDVEVSGALTWVDCGVEDIVQSYMGSGILGLKAMIETLLGVVNAGVSEYCALLSSQELLGEEVGSSSISMSQTDSFIDIDLNVETKIVVVDIETSSNPYAVRRGSSGGNDNEQARFGVISLLHDVDGDTGATKTVNQYYSKGIYAIPDEFVDSRAIRVSLSAGSTATVKEFK